MFKKQLLVLVLVLWLQNSSGFLDTMTAILKGAGMFVDFIKTLPSAAKSVKEVISIFSNGELTHHQVAPDSHTEHPRDNILIEGYYRELVAKFEDVDTKLNNLRLYMSDRFRRVQELIKDLPQEFDNILKKQIVGDFIMEINQRWINIMQFLKNGVNKDVYRDSILNTRQYIEQNLIKFRVAIAPRTTVSWINSGLLTEIARIQKMKRDTLCDGETSHRSIVHIFQIIILSEIKTFILQALAFNEAFPENDAWKQLLNQSKTNLEQQFSEYVYELKSAMAIERAPYVRGCDPEKWEYYDAYSYKWLSYSPPDLQCDKQPVECDAMGSCLSPRRLPTTSCACICVKYHKFILALIQSQVKYNYVVVAVRFHNIDNYIYIQIAEGKLEANGHISDYSWRLPTQRPNGENPFDASMSINEGKTLVIGDVQLAPGYILTGIKFSPQLIYAERGFKIGLHGVKFDYGTGKLDPTDETFVLASSSAKVSRWYELQCPNMKTTQNSSEYSVVEFRTSDFKHSDSPTELPSLNAAPVLPNPLSPLGGVGIFYHKAHNHTPCLSLRLFTIDYMDFIENFEKLGLSALTAS